MSLSALLNNDPEEDTKFLESLNREMDRLLQRDQLELAYQDWKFANFQEFELISEWNSQSKELVEETADDEYAEEEVRLDELYGHMDDITNEWKGYEAFKEAREKLLLETPSSNTNTNNNTTSTSNAADMTMKKPKRKRRTREEIEADEAAAAAAADAADAAAVLVGSANGGDLDSDTANGSNNRRRIGKSRGPKPALSGKRPGRPSNKSNETSAAITGGSAVQSETANGNSNMEARLPNSDTKNSDASATGSTSVSENPSATVSVAASSTNSDVEADDDNSSIIDDSEDNTTYSSDIDTRIDSDTDSSTGGDPDLLKDHDEFPTEDSEEDGPDTSDENNDDDFNGAARKKSSINKNITINSDRPKIVRELIKLCNKNKVPKPTKRRYTSATILDYSPTEKKITVKVTLKQMHVKKLKRIINEAKRAEEKKLQEEKSKQAQSESPRKRRKVEKPEEPPQKEETVVAKQPNTSGLPMYGMKMSLKDARAIQRHYDNTYSMIWKDMARKDCAKIARLVQQIQTTKALNHKKTSSLCAREARKWQSRNFKQLKDFQTRARRGIREMANFWKRNEREERDLKKKAEREALELAKKEEEEKESKRQAKKLNFLLTQTELYSHFIGRKIKTSELEGNDDLDDEQENFDLLSTAPNKNEFHAIDFDNEDDEQLKLKAAQNASNALAETRAKAKAFDEAHKASADDEDDEELNFQNPTSLGDITIEQPKMLACTLKEYQLKGLNWLANLYDQGINGILADEMGLGKTVQSISVLAHLAENHNIWGPFLVVTPASTLHNWVNEISKFVPQFKILPYWGSANDRKVLRTFWDRKNLRYTEKAPFHVMITSYQMVVADCAYLQKMKWQYMILDEAQAIKSSQSSRWKNLLSFHCRNRLLLTGTPIQNNMQELWALLHFIMPSLFDSHDEFNEWFSKDIESHAEGNSKLNQQQLRRLHMILKPFMLRRIKKNVQSELGDKIEIDVLCDLTQRQSKLYQVLKSQLSSNYDAIENAAAESSEGLGSAGGSDQNLINAVMQFRKVCNHPDLFERADINSPFSFAVFGKTSSLVSSAAAAAVTSNNKGEVFTDLMYSTQNPITYNIPRLVYEELLTPTDSNNYDTLEKILNSSFSIYQPVVNRPLCDSLKFLTGNDLGSFYDDYNTNLLTRAISLARKSTNNNSSLLIQSPEELLREIKNPSTGSEPELLSVQDTIYYNNYLNAMQPSYSPIVAAPPVNMNVPGSKRFSNLLQDYLFDPKITTSLSTIPPITQYHMLVDKKIPLDNFPVSELYPKTLNKHFSSTISMPSMDRFITESAKLKKLDELLYELKKNDHRVLIYFQMTKMMDLMEEYLTYRQYNHIRLDGSSKLEDRRDLVHDWQTKPEIFIFLLSTRAGGLGINLTAADTVIFYDSDWNPTIDSQAMDRAHRLGQTRQVTVYRLLVRGTIEERMRDRAKQKEQVQQVVMEGKTNDKQVKTIDDTSHLKQLTPESLASETAERGNMISVLN